MDSLTHILLGGLLAQSLSPRTLRRAAFPLGALASTLPDLDVFLHTGNTMLDHSLHRHFMHSLLLVPALALLATLPLLLFKKLRPLWPHMLLPATVACLSHTILDSLTSYGTMMLWPFSPKRIALDIIAVVDIPFTFILLIGLILSSRRLRNLPAPHPARPALISLTLAALYLAFAFLQHARAQIALKHLLASRNITHATNPRVLPQIGSVFTYRSLYLTGNTIHTDAIRVPLFSLPLFKPGTTIDRPTFLDLHANRSFAWEFNAYDLFTDGYFARDPDRPLQLADLRYTTSPNGTSPVWSLQLEATPIPLWHLHANARSLPTLLADLLNPTGYLPLP